MPQRSPVIFWLLLAATLAVDAAAIVRVMAEPSPSFASVAWDALVVSQLSLVCIWSALRREKTIWSRLAPVAAVFLALWAMSFGKVFGVSPLRDGLPYYGLQAALLVVALRILECTTFWRKRGGASATWQYSMAQLLGAMTVVAVLSAILRESRLFAAGSAVANGALIGGTVVLAVVSVVAWSLSSPWPLRLAIVLGCALALGAAFLLAGDRFLAQFVGAHYLIQAVVLSAWLALGGIIPRADPELNSGRAAPSDV